MNKTLKFFAILMIAITLISVTNVAFAKITPDQITGDETVTGEEKISSVGKKIVTIIRDVAAVAAVIVISILGVKFIIGSTEERAEYKKSFLPLIIGLVIVVGATSIAGWIWGML